MLKNETFSEIFHHCESRNIDTRNKMNNGRDLDLDTSLIMQNLSHRLRI